LNFKLDSSYRNHQLGPILVTENDVSQGKDHLHQRAESFVPVDERLEGHEVAEADGRQRDEAEVEGSTQRPGPYVIKLFTSVIYGFL